MTTFLEELRVPLIIHCISTVCAYILLSHYWPLAYAQDPVRYELIAGSSFSHTRVQPDGSRDAVGVRIEGTCTFRFARNFTADVVDIDFRSVEGEVAAYRLLGSGFYEILPNPHVVGGLPTFQVVCLGLLINDEFHVSLADEISEASTFPVIQALVFEQSRRSPDNFAMFLRLSPIAQDLARFFRRGDANEDAQTNLADPLVMLNDLFELGPRITCPDAADANDDGRIDVMDVVYLLRSLFLEGSGPPEPRYLCGLDLTVDSLSCGGQVSCRGESP